ERGRAALSDENDVGFESFVKARVGEAAYLAFYKPYAEKVWGIEPADLSQTVAKKRISSASPLRFFRSLTGRALAIASGSPRLGPDSFVYPRGGTSSIAAFLEARLAALGVHVEHGRSFHESDAFGKTALFAGDIASLVPAPGLEHRGLYLVYIALPV